MHEKLPYALDTTHLPPTYLNVVVLADAYLVRGTKSAYPLVL